MVDGPGGGVTNRRALVNTFTGRLVDVLDLDPADIAIEDIAHALALTNRFNGHTAYPISVAQHSVAVSRLVQCVAPEAALQALLHDGSEAYASDVTKWLKERPEMAAYREIEDRIQRAIFLAFGCDETLHPEVVAADWLMVRFEAWAGYGDRWQLGEVVPSPTPEEREMVRQAAGFWTPWPWREAKRRFLLEYGSLRSRTVYKAPTGWRIGPAEGDRSAGRAEVAETADRAPAGL